MASPSLFSQTISESAGLSDTSFSPTLSTHAAGDLIELDVGTDGNPTVSITSGTGWTLHWQLQNTTGSSTPTLAKITKVAGSSSESITLGMSPGDAMAVSCRVYRGSGGALNYYTPTPVNGTDSGSSVDGQGSAVNPGQGTQDFTFTQCMVMDGVQGTNAAPTGYSNYQTNNNAAAARVDISTAEKAATATGDTPGAWDSNAEQWIVGGGAVWETTSGGTTHAATGALANAGGALSGSASSATTRASSGSLSGAGGALSGAAARTKVHPSSGDLANPGGALAGSAARTRVHPASGDLSNTGASLSGAASSATTRAASGVLAGAGASLSGSAERIAPGGTHDSSATLAGTGGVLDGSAARFRAFASSGVLQGAGAQIAGSAQRTGAPVTHDSSGDLAGLGASIGGQAALPRRRRAGGRKRIYIIKGEKYLLDERELAQVLVQLQTEVKRAEVKREGKKPKVLSNSTWAKLQESMKALEVLTTPPAEPEDEDDELMMLLL